MGRPFQRRYRAKIAPYKGLGEHLIPVKPFKPASLSHGPRVMGILNITPDSFSDGGAFMRRDAAVAHARAMVEAGADLIDIGGESTRPGARAVSVQEELDRVIPVIEALAGEMSVSISIDTGKAEVMIAAAEAGAGLINDVRALREPGALEAAARTGLPVCLMHMQGRPQTMQAAPRYADVVSEVLAFLLERVSVCEAAGIDRAGIVLDPGFGFGKTLEHNLALFRALPEFVATGLPVLVGVSRKSMISAITGSGVDRRLGGSLAMAVLAAQAGVSILRVHDVFETVQAVKVTRAVHRIGVA